MDPSGQDASPGQLELARRSQAEVRSAELLLAEMARFTQQGAKRKELLGHLREHPRPHRAPQLVRNSHSVHGAVDGTEEGALCQPCGLCLITVARGTVKAPPAAVGEEEPALLRVELEQMKLSALRKRAIATGVDSRRGETVILMTPPVFPY